MRWILLFFVGSFGLSSLVKLPKGGVMFVRRRFADSGFACFSDVCLFGSISVGYFAVDLYCLYMSVSHFY